VQLLRDSTSLSFPRPNFSLEKSEKAQTWPPFHKSRSALGKFPLAGFASEQNIFGASDEASSPLSTTSDTSAEN
jgi:hypothetical protein